MTYFDTMFDPLDNKGAGLYVESGSCSAPPIETGDGQYMALTVSRVDGGFSVSAVLKYCVLHCSDCSSPTASTICLVYTVSAPDMSTKHEGPCFHKLTIQDQSCAGNIDACKYSDPGTLILVPLYSQGLE